MGELVRLDRWDETQARGAGTPDTKSRRASPEMRRRWLEQQVVRLLYRHSFALYLGSLAAAGVVVAVLWPVVSGTSALAWLGALTLAIGGQMALVRWFRRRAPTQDHEIWGRRLLIGSIANGVVWGALGVALYPVGSLPHQAFVVAVLCGVTATSVAILGVSRWGVVLLAAPLLVPLAVRLAIDGDPLHAGMSGLTVLYLAALLLASRQVRKSVVDGLSVRYENEELITELSEVNEGLISQIEARQQIDRELEKRDAILEAVSFAAERLLHSEDSIADPMPILERLAQAAGVQRLALVTLSCESGQVPRVEQHHEWRNPQSRLLPRHPPFSPAANPRWVERFRHGGAVSGSLLEFAAIDRGWLRRFGVESLAALPIFADSQWWGLLVLEDREGRTWSRVELEALTTASDILGAAVHRVATEKALATSDSRYQMLAENTNDLVGLHDLKGRYLYVSPSCQELLGYTPEELLGQDLAMLCSDDQLEQLAVDVLAPAQRGEITTVRWQIRTQDGEQRWFETTTQPVEDSSGTVSMLVTSSRDVTGHKETEDQLFREKELAQVTLQSIGDGVVTTGASGRVRFLNPVAEQLTGWTDAAARGKSIKRVFASARTEDQSRLEALVERTQQSDLPTHSERVIRLLNRDAEELAVEVSCAPIHDRGGQALGTVVVLRDVTRTQKLAAQLSYQATHDSLTGLLNRNEFEGRLGALVQEVKRRSAAGRSAGPHALCYLDLDQFKVVNDTCGHIAGDELLRQIARLVRSQVRHSDTVARLGGDEFGILLHDCSGAKAVEMAETLCTILVEHRFAWQGNVFRIGASIGVVEIDSATATDAAVLSAADAACYAAKDHGRGRVHLFTSGDRRLGSKTGEMHWVSEIHSALESDRLQLRYQPIVPPSSLVPRPQRVEILLSMIGPDGEAIEPNSFIPAAERFNAMGQLDRWVVRNTFESLAPHWRKPAPSLKECFINLSGASIADESFLAFLKDLLVEYRVPEGVVCFEITETTAIANLKRAASFMQELRDRGCRFALDDFGSGLSSFAYLRSLPIDFLKIDGTFVREIADDLVDYAIVESIQNVGRQLQIVTIAEFVETQAALAKLMLLGVDLVQGYAIAPPAPLEDLMVELGEVV